jgi:hypothetical protein
MNTANLTKTADLKPARQPDPRVEVRCIIRNCLTGEEMIGDVGMPESLAKRMRAGSTEEASTAAAA